MMLYPGHEITILTWLDNVHTILLFTFILSGHRKFCLDIFYFEIFIPKLSYYKYNVCLHFRKNTHLSGVKLVFYCLFFLRETNYRLRVLLVTKTLRERAFPPNFQACLFLLYFRINE